jgi:hypothetical protein
MSDYQCFPLRLTGDGMYENVSPNELPLSTLLKEKIQQWQVNYDRTLNMTNPEESGFSSIEEEEIFDKEPRSGTVSIL